MVLKIPKELEISNSVPSVSLNPGESQIAKCLS
jgi:hypothetical protein